MPHAPSRPTTAARPPRRRPRRLLASALSLALLGPAALPAAALADLPPTNARPGDPVDATGRYAGPPRIDDSRLEPAPAALQGVGVDEKLEAQLPLDLAFRDEDGNLVKLEKYFNNGRPVVLQLAYYECPMLCSLVSEGLVKSLDGLDVGGAFDVLTVSIDPTESPSLARLKKQNSFKAIGKPPGATGWTFLTGDQKSIDALADATGFRYKYVAASGEYSHPAVLTVLTPGGAVSNYLYGVQFEPGVMKDAIATAGRGATGTPLEQFIFTCYQVIHSIGLYSGRAMLLMRVAGVATVLAIAGGLFALVMRERYRTPVLDAAGADGLEGDDNDPRR